VRGAALPEGIREHRSSTLAAMVSARAAVSFTPLRRPDLLSARSALRSRRAAFFQKLNPERPGPLRCVGQQQHHRRRFADVNREGSVMAKHRAISEHSLQARTVIGSVVASGALLVGAPAGVALADHHHPGTGNSGTPTTHQQESFNKTPTVNETSSVNTVTPSLAAPKVTPSLEPPKGSPQAEGQEALAKEQLLTQVQSSPIGQAIFGLISKDPALAAKVQGLITFWVKDCNGKC